MSEQPSSPVTPVTAPASPNPLPTHSCPLRPLSGSNGPNAAGLARKKVELSSVRLIIADGGKRDEGILKEKRACNPVVGPASAFGVATWVDDDRAEKKVRKIGRKIKQNARRTRRGGRMLQEMDVTN